MQFWKKGYTSAVQVGFQGVNFKDMKVHFIRRHSAGFCDIFILFLMKMELKPKL